MNELTDYQLEHSDEWDREIERDSQPGGRLDAVLKRVRDDIAVKSTKRCDNELDRIES